MTKANSGFFEDPSQTADDVAKALAPSEAGTVAPLVYSPHMNQEIMRQLSEVNAMVLAKVGSLSPEQQAQFHALIEQTNLLEANGHLDS